MKRFMLKGFMLKKFIPKKFIPRIFFQSLLSWIVSILWMVNGVLGYPVLSGTLVAQGEEPAQQPVEQLQPSEPTPAEKSTETQSTETQQRQTPQTNLTDAREQRATESSQDSAGPYDMEAIKAFNRALYGS
jgi:hypothetical protein